MKNLIFILFVFVTIKSFAQDTIPVEGVNEIVVKNDRSAIENFSLVKEILKEKKIKIENENKDSLFIKTKDSKISKTGTYAYFKIVCKAGEIHLRGGTKPSKVMYIGGKEFKGASFVIAYRKTKFTNGVELKGDMFIESFEVMESLARALGTSVHYYLVKSK